MVAALRPLQKTAEPGDELLRFVRSGSIGLAKRGNFGCRLAPGRGTLTACRPRRSQQALRASRGVARPRRSRSQQRMARRSIGSRPIRASQCGRSARDWLLLRHQAQASPRLLRPLDCLCTRASGERQPGGRSGCSQAAELLVAAALRWESRRLQRCPPSAWCLEANRRVGGRLGPREVGRRRSGVCVSPGGRWSPRRSADRIGSPPAGFWIRF